MSREPELGRLHPLNGCVLVELKQSTKNFNVKEGKYDSRTEGVVVRVPKKDFALSSDNPMNVNKTMAYGELLGKYIYFEEFKEGARIKRGTKIYSFIKVEDIRGYEDNEQAS